MADKTVTTFEKMGDNIVSHLIGNVGANQSPNTIPVPKKGPKGGSEPATAGGRKGTLERHGSSLHPTATLYKQTAAEASQTQKRTYLVSSAIGNRDFYAKRQYGQNMQ